MATTLARHETHESQSLFARAIEKLSRNNTAEAIKDLEEALQISPRNASYLSHYGLCVAMEHGDLSAALKLCRRAVEIDPKCPINQVNLGKVHRLRGENALAHQIFLKAWRADKNHPSPAAELSRMGIRRRPVLRFLSRSHWLNVRLGKMRARIERALGRQF